MLVIDQWCFKANHLDEEDLSNQIGIKQIQQIYRYSWGSVIQIFRQNILQAHLKLTKTFSSMLFLFRKDKELLLIKPLYDVFTKQNIFIFQFLNSSPCINQFKKKFTEVYYRSLVIPLRYFSVLLLAIIQRKQYIFESQKTSNEQLIQGHDLYDMSIHYQKLPTKTINQKLYNFAISKQLNNYNMNPKKNPSNWSAWGKLQYPFYLAKQLDKMNKISTVCWISANGEPDLPSDKFFDFVVAGTPVDPLKGRIERYQISITTQTLKKNDLQISPYIEYKLQYPVLKASVCGDLMAVRTLEEGALIYRLNKPPEPLKLKFNQVARQNSNNTLAWRSDRQQLLAASSSKTIFVWDLNKQKCKIGVKFHKKDVTDLVWLNNKYFASASYGGEICLWSVDEPNPICGFKNDYSINGTASTSLALAKSGSVEDAILLSGTDKVVSLWQKSIRNKIQFCNNHSFPIMKVQYQGIVCRDRLFGALDKQGRIVLYDRNGKQSVFNNPDIEDISDFNCKNGFFGLVSQRSQNLVIWTPASQKSLQKMAKCK